MTIERRPDTSFELLKKLYATLRDHSTELNELTTQRRAIDDAYRANQQAFIEGKFDRRVPYGEAFLSEQDIERFAIEISPDGKLLTSATTHPHLQPTQERPDQVWLTRANVDAASEWGMLPQFPDLLPATESATRVALALDQAEYYAQLRAFYSEKALFHQQIFDYIRLRSEEGQLTLTNLPTESVTQPLEPNSVRAHRHFNPQLAERMIYSLLASLGGYAEPGLRAYKADPSTDLFNHVDVTARPLIDGVAPWLVGFDVTTNRDAAKLEKKAAHFRTAVGGTRARYATDPITLQRVPLFGAVVSWPRGLAPIAVYEEWQQRRGNTMVTPEYIMPSAIRGQLAADLLEQICAPDGRKIYADGQGEHIYRATFDYFDQHKKRS